MIWFIISAAALLLAACIPVMSCMQTFGGDR